MFLLSIGLVVLITTSSEDIMLWARGITMSTS